MPKPKRRSVTRRNFIKLAAGAAAVGPFFVFTPNAFASEKTLKVAKWAHFLPEFDDWFINVMAPEWGKQNKTQITVDVIPVEEIRDRAFAEVTAGGVDTNGLSAKTMECRKIPGLYFIGEVVDVTGHLGGFNFQWAWASGFCAGQSV